MNTWHESLASCSAPQENQYNIATFFPPSPPPPKQKPPAGSGAAAATAQEDGGCKEADGRAGADTNGTPPAAYEEEKDDDMDDDGYLYPFGDHDGAADVDRGEESAGPNYGQELGQRYQQRGYY